MGIINVKNLHRVYKTQKKEVVAVKDVSFSIEKGEIFGLLGPNGAGKTTTIKILSTLLLPTNGEVTINGLDVIKDRTQIRNKIGIILGGERGLYWRLTARENLYYFAELYNMDRREYKKRANHLLELVGLEDAADRLVETYSKGMKQRLHFARGLLNKPEIIFMDEPTLGLDPHVAVYLRSLVKDLSKKGSTILYTSHYMNEADELCDRIAIIKSGEIRTIDTPTHLKEQLKEMHVIDITFDNLLDIELKKLISHYHEINIISKEGNKIMLEVPLQLEALPLMMSFFKNSNIINFKVKEYTLEDVYLKVAGE